MAVRSIAAAIRNDILQPASVPWIDFSDSWLKSWTFFFVNNLEFAIYLTSKHI